MFAKTGMKQKLGLLNTSLHKASKNQRVAILTYYYTQYTESNEGKKFLRTYMYSRLISVPVFSVSLLS